MHRPSKNSESPVLPQLTAEWDHWKRVVRESPAVRADKIAHGRSAIASGAYDDDSVIEDTLDKMMDAMGVRFHD